MLETHDLKCMIWNTCFETHDLKYMLETQRHCASQKMLTTPSPSAMNARLASIQQKAVFQLTDNPQDCRKPAVLHAELNMQFNCAFVNNYCSKCTSCTCRWRLCNTWHIDEPAEPSSTASLASKASLELTGITLAASTFRTRLALSDTNFTTS